MAERKLPIGIMSGVPVWLEINDRNWAWLSRETGIPYSTLYAIFIQKTFEIDRKKAGLINKALDTDFI